MRIAFALTLLFAATSTVSAADWLMMPSTYSHHPVTGQRVTQYRETPRPEAPAATNFRSSGYTHYRSSVNYGQSADNYHRVDTWGGNIRPYGEWRFPYRPYSTPYQNWGPPFGGLNIGVLPGAGYFPGAFTRGGYRPTAGTPATGSGNANSGSANGGNTGTQNSDLWPMERRQNRLVPHGVNPSNLDPRSPYSASPYSDGYHPVYPQ